jgi:hypothetical protein
MADIILTQTRGTTHHFTALIPVDPADLEPTVDLENALDADGNPIEILDAITQDPELEFIIDANFKQVSDSVSNVIFKPGSFDADALTIQLQITTSAVVVEQDAVSIKWEFLHSATR